MKRYKYVVESESQEHLQLAMDLLMQAQGDVGRSEDDRDACEEAYDFVKSLRKAMKKCKEIVVLPDPPQEYET